MGAGGTFVSSGWKEWNLRRKRVESPEEKNGISGGNEWNLRRKRSFRPQQVAKASAGIAKTTLG